MAELVIYRGLPASGKTSLARHRQEANGGALCGRDHIRLTVFNKTWGLNRDQENRVTDVQDAMIRAALRTGHDALVDDMNLRPKYVKRLLQIAHEEGSDVDVVDLTDVRLDECFRRDRNRVHCVGEDVIRDQYLKHIRGKPSPLPMPDLDNDTLEHREPYVPDVMKPSTIVVDVDGTVALNTSGRSFFDMTRVSEDEPNENVIRIVSDLFLRGYGVVFLSGRDESARADTEAWLDKHVGFCRPLAMRAVGDQRRDSIVKYELFDKHVRHNYNVVAAFDDRDQVVEMWRSIGVTCLQVDYGNF